MHLEAFFIITSYYCYFTCEKMAESPKVVVVVALLVLAARVASCLQDFRVSQVHPHPYNPVLLAPELEVSLSVALALSSSTQSLPRRVDIRCSPERRRCSLPANLPGSPWFLLLVLCGDVETNPGPVCGCQHPSRRCDKVPSFTFTHLNVRSLFRHLDQVTEFDMLCGVW